MVRVLLYCLYNAYFISDPNEIQRFLSIQTRNFSHNQAYIFGSQLGLTNEQVDDIAAEMSARTGGDIVLHTFNYIDRRHTNIEVPLLEQIITALYAAADDVDETENENTPIIITHEEDEITSHRRGLFDNEDPYSSHQQASRNGLGRTVKVCHYNSCVITFIIFVIELRYIAFLLVKIATVVLGVIALTVLMCLIYLPRFPNFPIQVIQPNDVVLYNIPTNTYWLRGLELVLLGSGVCTASVISLQCESVQFAVNESSIETNVTATVLDYLYYVRESTVTFTLENDPDCSFCNPYFVWLFVSILDADTNAESNFNQLACLDPPANAYCIEVTTVVKFTIPKSSYYFIRCERDPTCTQLERLQYNSSNYDYQLSSSFQIESVSLLNGNDGGRYMNIKDSSFNPVASQEVENLCLLMQLNDGQCSGVPPIYHVTVELQKWEDLIFYPAFGMGIIGIIATVYSSIFCFKK